MADNCLLDDISCEYYIIFLETQTESHNTQIFWKSLFSSRILYPNHRTEEAKECIINKIILDDDFSNWTRNDMNSPKPQYARQRSVLVLRTVQSDEFFSTGKKYL